MTASWIKRLLGTAESSPVVRDSQAVPFRMETRTPCTHDDWRIEPASDDPAGWVDAHDFTYGVGSYGSILLSYSPGQKKYKRRLVCATCLDTKIEDRTENVAKDWPKA